MVGVYTSIWIQLYYYDCSAMSMRRVTPVGDGVITSPTPQNQCHFSDRISEHDWRRHLGSAFIVYILAIEVDRYLHIFNIKRVKLFSSFFTCLRIIYELDLLVRT